MSATLNPPAIPPGSAAGSPLGALAQLAGNEPWPAAKDGVTKQAEEQERATPDASVKQRLEDWIEMVNIAEDPDLDMAELNALAQRVQRDYDIDKNSRSDWESKYQQWLDFAMQVVEEKTYPWPQASNVIYPLMTSASIQFAARAYPAIIRDQNVVKGSVIGQDDGQPQTGANGQPMQGPDGQPIWNVAPGEKQKRADRIGEHMSWQLLDEQEEWEPQTDRMLIILPIVGTMFRKSYFDPSMERNVSETVTALDVVVNYRAKSFESCARVTQIVRYYPWEIEEKIRSGVFLDEDYGTDSMQANAQDEDAEVTFLEQHRRYDLDGDGYAEPYIITISETSMKLARIVAAFDIDDVKFSPKDGRVMKVTPTTYFTKYGFHPSPESGVYDIGFGHLLFPLNSSINSSLNQLFDAGHLANAGGGFIGSQLSMNTGAVRFQVGEYKTINTNGATIRDNVFPIPFPGPNQTLFQLLQFLVDAAKDIAAVKDIMVGDHPGDNTSGITTLAVIEQGLQVFSAIYKRIHRGLKSEFGKLYKLNKKYLPVSSEYQKGEEWKSITREDYEAGAGVMPVSDPRMMTDMQRLGRAQFLLQFKDDPWFDGRLIRKQMLEAAQVPDADKLLVQKLPPNPQMASDVAKMQLQHETLQIRAAHEEAEMDIRRGKDKASEIETLTRAILNLANAQKADHASQQGWYGRQIDHLRLQMEMLNAAGQQNPTADSPAAAAGLAGGSDGASGAPGGAQPPAVPAMAPPPGVGAGVPVPAGLPGGAGP